MITGRMHYLVRIMGCFIYTQISYSSLLFLNWFVTLHFSIKPRLFCIMSFNVGNNCFIRFHWPLKNVCVNKYVMQVKFHLIITELLPFVMFFLSMVNGIIEIEWAKSQFWCVKLQKTVFMDMDNMMYINCWQFIQELCPFVIFSIWMWILLIYPTFSTLIVYLNLLLIM